MTKEILIKFLNNRCTEAELKEVIRWAKTGALTKEGKKLGFDDWKNYQEEDGLGSDEKFSALFDKIQKKIDKPLTLPTLTRWMARAAAILFIPLLGVVFYMLSNNNIQSGKYADLAVDSLEIIAPIGSRTVVQLSDGTEVNLNYGSRIKYPRIFTGDTREITLTGEGYFDVAHNPEQPFVVKTGKLNVKALGTEFNVHAYPDDDVVATTLVEGKVVIEKTISGEKTETVGALVPGQHVAYNLKSGKILSTIGGIEKYIAWKDGKLVFDNEPITQVAEKLSRMFNVEIEVAENAKQNTYTVTFANDPLFLILDLMKETTPVTYKAFPRKKLADGTFSKQRIRIEKRI
jgi:ferric-dicitrate binding protein FerR (iron transport regulator)